MKERRIDSQNEEPVRLVSHVSVSGPGFDLQSLGVTPLRSVQWLQQARCANVHRFKGAELQTENLTKFLVIINLEWIWKHNSQREKIVKDFYLFYFTSMEGKLGKGS